MTLMSATFQHAVRYAAVILLVAMYVGVGNVPAHAQTGGKEPGIPRDEQNHQAADKTTDGLPPETLSARRAPEIIRETINTNITSWASATGAVEKLDWIHMKIFRTAQAQVDMVDDWFKPRQGEEHLVGLSRFRLGVFGQGVVRNDGFDVTGVIDADTDIELPNMERRMKLMFTTRDPNALPGTDITEQRDRNLHAAVEGQWLAALSTAIGGRLGVPPELFANVAWSPKWKSGDWLLYPQEKVYWDSGDGFGAISTLVVDHWNEGLNTRFTTSIKCSELDWKSDRQLDRKDEGFRWSEVFMFGFAKELLDETTIERLVAGDDVARGLGIRVAAFGGFHLVDEYRVGVFCRWPVQRRWLYLLVAPDVNWTRVNNWEHEWTIKCGIEMLFWGGRNR